MQSGGSVSRVNTVSIDLYLLPFYAFMACSCEIFTRPILDVSFQEHGFRRNVAVSVLSHFVISSFPVDLLLLHAEFSRVFTISEPCIVQHICERDQQDSHFISCICFNYTILYMFRTNKFIIRMLLLYKQRLYILYTHGKYYMLLVLYRSNLLMINFLVRNM